MEFEEDSLEDNLSTCESEISKHQLATKSDLPDPILIDIVINGTFGHLQQWIQLQSSSLKDYKTLRDSVVSYARSRRFTTSSAMPISSTSLMPMGWMAF